MYHDVVTGDPDVSGFAGRGPGRYKLSWSAFVQHLDRIADAVETPPGVVGDLVNRDEFSPWWALTFDDGGASALQIGEELSRRSWRGHFFVTTGLVGTTGFMDEDAIRGLHRMGHVIGSHSVSHPERMSALPDHELVREWRVSLDTLADVLGEEVCTASVPGGYYTRRVAIAADKAGIAALFTSEPVRTVDRVAACLVIGRHSVRNDMTARDAARVATGEGMPWVLQYSGWNFRKVIKALGGEQYVRARRALLRTRAGRRR